jgi:hypothetical protein
MENSEKFPQRIERVGEIGNGHIHGTKSVCNQRGQCYWRLNPGPGKESHRERFKAFSEWTGNLIGLPRLLITLGGMGFFLLPAAPFGVRCLSLSYHRGDNGAGYVRTNVGETKKMLFKQNGRPRLILLGSIPERWTTI